jgi:hypothetical protein
MQQYTELVDVCAAACVNALQATVPVLNVRLLGLLRLHLVPPLAALSLPVFLLSCVRRCWDAVLDEACFLSFSCWLLLTLSFCQLCNGKEGDNKIEIKIDSSTAQKELPLMRLQSQTNGAYQSINQSIGQKNARFLTSSCRLSWTGM